MTPTQAIDFCRGAADLEGDGLVSDQEVLNYYVAACNEVLSIIGLIEAKDTTITTVIGTDAYAYPAYVEFLKEVQYNGAKLQEITFLQYEIERRVSTSGVPLYFVPWNRQIILVPTPSDAQVLTLYVEKSHPLITASDTILMPTVLQTRICNKAIYYMLMKDFLTSNAMSYLNTWNNSDIPAFREYKRQLKSRGKFNIVATEEDSPVSIYGIL